MWKKETKKDMKWIQYLSILAVPLIMTIILGYGIKEKKKVYDIFLEGATKGAKMALQLFPTLLAIFLAVSLLRNSGVIDFITQIIQPITKVLQIPVEVMPLALLRPISGSASMAVATDIMTQYGVDSIIGLMTATIMGSTETTFYTIAVYTSSVHIKKTRFVLFPALCADFVGMLCAVIIWRFLS